MRKVLRANSAAVPAILRPEKAEPYRQQVLELMQTCEGNLVRVREELAASGVSLSYSTLTGFCHRHGIGQPPVVAAGRYDFQPGEEMQHDTSPHEVHLGGQRRRVQTASAVLAYSHLLFFQIYPTFQRFDRKACRPKPYATSASSACNGVMIDRPTSVALRGIGSQMVPVAEMAALPDVSASRFQAHERGDATLLGRAVPPLHLDPAQLPGRPHLRRTAGANR